MWSFYTEVEHALKITEPVTYPWGPAALSIVARQGGVGMSSNLFLLITSSFVYSSGLVFMEAGNPRRLIQCCVATMAIGSLFLLLKFYEWHIDIFGAPVSGETIQNHRGRRRGRESVLVVLLRRHRAACPRT